MIAEPDEHDVCGRCGFTYGHHVGVWPEAGCEKIGGPQFATGIRHELLGEVPLEQVRAIVRSELVAHEAKMRGLISDAVRDAVRICLVPAANLPPAADPPPAVEHLERCASQRREDGRYGDCDCGASDPKAGDDWPPECTCPKTAADPLWPNRDPKCRAHAPDREAPKPTEPEWDRDGGALPPKELRLHRPRGAKCWYMHSPNAAEPVTADYVPLSALTEALGVLGDLAAIQHHCEECFERMATRKGDHGGYYWCDECKPTEPVSDTKDAPVVRRAQAILARHGVKS